MSIASRRVTHTSDGPASRLVSHPQVCSPIAAVKHGVQVGTIWPEAEVVVGFEDHPLRQGQVGVAMRLARCGSDVHEHDARHRDHGGLTLAWVAVVAIL